MGDAQLRGATGLRDTDRGFPRTLMLEKYRFRCDSQSWGDSLPRCGPPPGFAPSRNYSSGILVALGESINVGGVFVMTDEAKPNKLKLREIIDARFPPPSCSQFSPGSDTG